MAAAHRPEPGSGPDGAQRFTELVGRAAVIAELDRGLTEAAAGRGALHLVTGEPGIGKTAVLLAAADRARDRGFRVAWAAGWPGDGAPAYWLWQQVLRALELPFAAPRAEPPDPEAAAAIQFELFDRTSSALLAESLMEPVLLVLDDLHWADTSSLQLLDFLARRLPAGSCAGIGGYRSGGTSDPGLAGLAARHRVIPLSPLSAAQVTELARAVLGRAVAPELAADLLRRSGGNPFYVRQLTWSVEAGTAGIPAGARESLAERFSALPDGCRELLAAAAVIGSEQDIGLLTRLTGQPAERVHELLLAGREAGVLALAGDRSGADAQYRFSHDLFREFLLDRLSPTERADRHARTYAALLAQDSTAGVPAATLAAHAVAADPHAEAAWRWSAAAAEDAGARLALAEAVGHWERALAAAGPDPLRVIRTLLACARARVRAGMPAEAEHAYRQAAELSRGTEPALLAEAALGSYAVGRRKWWPVDDLVELLTEARDALPDQPVTVRQRLLLSAALARVLAWHGLDPVRARGLAGQAVAGARQLADPPVLIACLFALHHVSVDLEQRAAALAELQALAERADDPAALREVVLLDAADRLRGGDPTFREQLAEFLRLTDQDAEPRAQYAGTVRRALLATLAGRLLEAEQLVQEAAGLGKDCGEPGTEDVRLDQLWTLRMLQGREAELPEPAADPMFPDSRSAQARGSRALVLLARGDRRSAGQELAALADQPLPRPRSDADLVETIFATELIVRLGDRRLAAMAFDALLPFADRMAVSGVAISFVGAVSHHLGVLAQLLGRTEDAERQLGQAVTRHEELAAGPWELLSRYQLARLRLARPDRREQALAELADVARQARRIGMGGLVKDAEAARVAAGMPPTAAGVFARQGEFWTLEYAGAAVRLRHVKGLTDLAVLLSRPGRPVAATELMAAGDIATESRADLAFGADPMLDETARSQYRARLHDLDREIEEADSWHDPVRAARARQERDQLVATLAAAIGLAGRSRRLGDPAERARKAVTGRIRDAIGRIAEVHPELADHLRGSVQTGTSCCYSPTAPTSWRLRP